jgi:phage-related protein
VRVSVNEKTNVIPRDINMMVPYMTKILEVPDRDDQANGALVEKYLSDSGGIKTFYWLTPKLILL